MFIVYGGIAGMEASDNLYVLDLTKMHWELIPASS
jgi:hypothetical protein